MHTSNFLCFRNLHTSCRIEVLRVRRSSLGLASLGRAEKALGMLYRCKATSSARLQPHVLAVCRAFWKILTNLDFTVLGKPRWFPATMSRTSDMMLCCLVIWIIPSMLIPWNTLNSFIHYKTMYRIITAGSCLTIHPSLELLLARAMSRPFRWSASQLPTRTSQVPRHINFMCPWIISPNYLTEISIL